MEGAILGRVDALRQVRINAVTGNSLEDFGFVHSQNSRDFFGLLVNGQLNFFTVAFNDDRPDVDRCGIDVVGVNRMGKNVPVGVHNVTAKRFDGSGNLAFFLGNLVDCSRVNVLELHESEAKDNGQNQCEAGE